MVRKTRHITFMNKYIVMFSYENMMSEFIFDLQNLVVTLANACHEIISNLRVTPLTLNTFVQTLISLAHAHAANKNIISCTLTQHNQHNTDNGIKTSL